jgi:hypothetical protein
MSALERAPCRHTHDTPPNLFSFASSSRSANTYTKDTTAQHTARTPLSPPLNSLASPHLLVVTVAELTQVPLRHLGKEEGARRKEEGGRRKEDGERKVARR